VFFATLLDTRHRVRIEGFLNGLRFTIAQRLRSNGHA
jgi:hypothetical protein